MAILQLGKLKNAHWLMNRTDDFACYKSKRWDHCKATNENNHGKIDNLEMPFKDLLLLLFLLKPTPSPFRKFAVHSFLEPKSQATSTFNLVVNKPFFSVYNTKLSNAQQHTAPTNEICMNALVSIWVKAIAIITELAKTWAFPCPQRWNKTKPNRKRKQWWETGRGRDW